MSDNSGTVRPESTSEPDPRSAGGSPRRWVSLAAICGAAGLVWLAFADLGVAVPTIADDFHADLSALAWANNAFSLVAGSLVIAAGKFGDVFGRRRMLLLGVALFSGFSVLAALAGNVEMLILGRALMGIGAALILPATLALIPPQFSGRALLTAFGVWQAVAWGGQAVAPAIGGVITDTVGWPWLFWINIPLGLGVYTVIQALTPESSDAAASRKVDWLGLATIGLAVFALLFALTEGPDAGWSSPLVIVPLGAAVVLAAAWVWIERAVSDPLVDLSLFRLRPYDGALTANLVMNLAYAGLTYLLVLWLQNARGYSAVEAGMLMLPATIGIFAFIPIGGRLDAARGGRVPVLLGLIVLGLGLFAFAPMRAGSGLWLLALGLVVVGVGLGMLSTPVSNTAVGDVPEQLAGTAAGVFKMSSMVGGALGIAVLTALARGFTTHDSGHAATQAGLSPDDVATVQQSLVNSASYTDAVSSLPEPLRDEVTAATVDAFSYGVAQAALVTGVVSIVAAATVAFVWPRRSSDIG
ncbi:MFS transporter [Rhodococcus gannanensis]|uniref:MFS transporter n=1 Tax=Rhodococcus gannanensis TaxID=1960308 RepID=A0ABW4P0N5_9NOCA